MFCPQGQECVAGLCVPGTGGDTAADELGSESSTSNSETETETETETTTTGGRCSEGQSGCPCGPGDACDPGLECIDGTCMFEGGEESTSTSEGGTTTDGTTTDGTTTDGTTGGEIYGMCGWSIPFGGYGCHEMGDRNWTQEDPDGVHPIECPPGLTEPGLCPEGFTYLGCCEPGGTFWYCEAGFSMSYECGG